MEPQSLIVLLIVGLVAGWLAGKLVRGFGFGMIGNIAIGIVGAFLGSWLLDALHVPLDGGFFRHVITATIGAVVLLVIVGLVRRM